MVNEKDYAAWKKEKGITVEF
jgi:hypothetical protein